MTAEDVIRLLDLAPHPAEGGWFRETYRSAHSTAIYYLLTDATFSEMHRLPGDEIFHFYLGDPVEMLELHPDGSTSVTILGPELGEQVVQHLVPGGSWQGARLIDGGRWALLGTTMAPGFAYEDYESGTEELVARYPERAAMIEKLFIGRAQ